MSIWWYLYAELMLWAQSHLAGYEFGRSNPDLIDRISEEFDEEITRYLMYSNISDFSGRGITLTTRSYE